MPELIHDRTLPPDARLEVWGRVYDLYMTKDERGYGGVAYPTGEITGGWESQLVDHSFRSNALGDVVATVYQHVTPGADNDDHEHDGDEHLVEGIAWLDRESDPSGHDTHPDNYLDWSSQALWQDLADSRLAIAGLEQVGGMTQTQGQAALIQRMRNVRAALRQREEDLPPEEE